MVNLEAGRNSPHKSHVRQPMNTLSLARTVGPRTDPYLSIPIATAAVHNQQPLFGSGTHLSQNLFGNRSSPQFSLSAALLLDSQLQLRENAPSSLG